MAQSGRVIVTWDGELRLLRGFASRVARTLAGPRRAGAARAGAYLASLDEAFGPAIATLRDFPPVGTLVLDAGAIAALGNGDATARTHLARAVAHVAWILVPASVLLEEHLVPIADALTARPVPLDARHAREAGALVTRARIRAPLDALTVAVAMRARSAAILTRERSHVAAFVRVARRTTLHVLALDVDR